MDQRILGRKAKKILGQASLPQMWRIMVDDSESQFLTNFHVASGFKDGKHRGPSWNDGDFYKWIEAASSAYAVHYLYAGVADLVSETGDPVLLETLKTIWDDVSKSKLYVTGACGALFDGASPDGSSTQKSISRIHQAYGRAYQLPNSTAHNESCATIGNILWNWRMLEITGDAKYADVLELAL